eukprot:631133-Pleurochrysis_carterae.AAC.1
MKTSRMPSARAAASSILSEMLGGCSGDSCSSGDIGRLDFSCASADFVATQAAEGKAAATVNEWEGVKAVNKAEATSERAADSGAAACGGGD